jgi:hypothetical protein
VLVIQGFYYRRLILRQGTASQVAEKLVLPKVLRQGTTSVVPLSLLILSSRGDFSRRGICFSDRFRSLFSRAVKPFILSSRGDFSRRGSAVSTFSAALKACSTYLALGVS